MKKILAAVSVGILLVAGQAAAAQNDAVVRVGDRIGAQAGDASEFRGIPAPVVIIGSIALIALIVVVTDDDSESD